MTAEDVFFAYGADAGFVKSPASRDRAKREAASGEFNARASLILGVLRTAPGGATWREIGSRLNLHHGQVSGALSNLHRKGFVFMLSEKRDRCHPYVHADYAHKYSPVDRIDVPAKTVSGQRREIERIILAEILSDPSVDLVVTNHVLADAIARYRRMNHG